MAFEKRQQTRGRLQKKRTGSQKKKSLRILWKRE